MLFVEQGRYTLITVFYAVFVFDNRINGSSATSNAINTDGEFFGLGEPFSAAFEGTGGGDEEKGSEEENEANATELMAVRWRVLPQ